jgi:ATP-dependent RNA helicase RhlE
MNLAELQMSFDSLGLAEPLLRAVRDAGYSTPTPIQAQAIPAVLSGGDVMGGAQTGTGKTAGFVLPLLHRLMAKPAARDARGKLPIRCLIRRRRAGPPRRSRERPTYGKHSRLTSMVMFGGVGMQPQLDKLKRRRHLGRDAGAPPTTTASAPWTSGTSRSSLDEADRMLDMGFILTSRRPGLPRKASLLSAFSDEMGASPIAARQAATDRAARNQTAEPRRAEGPSGRPRLKKDCSRT